LSRSIQKLSEKGLPGGQPLLVRDVESRLCSHSEVWSQGVFSGVGADRRNMAELCSQLPRRALSVHWGKALSSCLGEIQNCPDSRGVLACHLTLFSPRRQEFYVPWRPADFRAASGHTDGALSVSRVVVLIDDIYDMYSRLSGAGEIFNEEQQARNYSDFYQKLSGVSLSSAETGTPYLLRLEVRRRSLEALASWRRAELVHAEALAQALGGIPLTVLAVKHRLSALQAIVESPRRKVVYVSHKISDARRYNRKNPGEWPLLVQEINELSPAFMNGDVVLAHPTAIDELRTRSGPGAIGLTDRWPLQEPSVDDLIYTLPSSAEDPPGYESLFDGLRFEGEGSSEEATAVFRGLELGIFQDIAFRDHLLVAASEGIVLYRPLALDGEDSGGARAEVRHWQDRWIHEPPVLRPRLVALHAFQDMAMRLEKLTGAERAVLRLHMQQFLEDRGWDRVYAEQILFSGPMSSLQLEQLSGAENPGRDLEFAAGASLFQCFLSWMCNVSKKEARDGAALIAAKDEASLGSATVVAEACRFLNGQEDAASLTSRNLVAFAENLGFDSLTGLAQSLLGSRAH